VAQDSLQWAQHATNGFHRDMLISYDLLVSGLVSIGECTSATTLCGKSLHVALQTTGFDSSETLQCHIRLSALLGQLNRYHLALKHLSAARYIALLMGGQGHPDILTILTKLASIYKSAKYYEDAAICLEDCHLRLAVGGDQVRHAIILENLAETYTLAEKFAHASSRQRAAILLMEQLFGSEHESTLRSKTKLNAIVRQSTEKSVAIARKKMEDDAAEKERQRLNWLEDDVTSNKNGKGNRVSAGKKKRGGKKK